VLLRKSPNRKKRKEKELKALPFRVEKGEKETSDGCGLSVLGKGETERGIFLHSHWKGK